MFDSLCLMFDSLFSPNTLLVDIENRKTVTEHQETPCEEMGYDIVTEAWDECFRKLSGSFPVITKLKNGEE